MAWVRLDDQFPDHPKVAGLTNDAFCLHVTAMCWTAKQQTDGKLPSRLLSRLAWRCQDPATAAAELVNAGVWDIDPVDGWEIHDYGEYNPTKAQSDELAGKRSEAGKAGAMARWQNRSKPDGKSHGKSHGKHNGKTMPPTPTPSPESEMRDRPPSPAPIDLLQNGEDPEWQAALAKLDTQWLGSVTGSVQLKLARVWPQMTNGKRSWLDDAIAEAVARNARTPDYAITVLANALRDNKRPGEPQPVVRGKAKTTSADLDAIFGVDIHGNPV